MVDATGEHFLVATGKYSHVATGEYSPVATREYSPVASTNHPSDRVSECFFEEFDLRFEISG